MHDKVGVLIEAGFMTNVDDMAVLVNNYKEIGKAIADGINTYVGGAIPNPDNNDCLLKVEELEKKISDLEKTAKDNKIQINLLTKENTTLKGKISNAIKSLS